MQNTTRSSRLSGKVRFAGHHALPVTAHGVTTGVQRVMACSTAPSNRKGVSTSVSRKTNQQTKTPKKETKPKETNTF